LRNNTNWRAWLKLLALESQTMKAEAQMDQDPRLSALLRECKVVATLPPRFCDGVWRRIAQREQEPSAMTALWAAFNRWIDARLPRPALAASYLTVLLIIGAGAGWAQAHQEKARVSSELSSRYVQSIDPYQAAR
jgi:hypothetical protein